MQLPCLIVQVFVVLALDLFNALLIELDLVFDGLQVLSFTFGASLLVFKSGVFCLLKRSQV